MEGPSANILDMIFGGQTAAFPAPAPTNTLRTDIQCETRTPFPQYTPIAMAYVPFQQWERPYDDNVALSRGTIFPSLDKPFIGEEAVKNAGKR
ncbi:MAG: spore coat associated protein CotJA [Oscillospiraceae bacterium]|jgi:hypothetical protein